VPNHVVFLVHGMGCRDARWRDAGIQCLKNSAATYPGTADPGRWESVVFEDLLYGPILQGVINDWELLARAVLEQTPMAEKAAMEGLLDWLAGQKGSFYWTHLVDILLWRLHPQIRNLVLSSLVSDFAAKAGTHLQDNAGRVPAFHVFAHSLGTSVAHGLVQALAADALLVGQAVPCGWAPPQFRFGTLAMFANVAKLLECPGWPVYQGPLRPSSQALDGFACHGYLSFEHVLDPFTRPAPFDPPWDAAGFRRIRVNHLHQANVHGFEHFLLNPQVHIPLLRTLFGYSTVTPAEELAANHAFPRFPAAGSEQLAARIENLRADTPDWTARTRTWFDFLNLG
jgi:hypothetical protein